MYNLFFIAIFFISYSLYINRIVNAECIAVSLVDFNNLECYNDLSIELRNLMHMDPFAKTEEVSCYYHCSLEENGLMENSTFLLENMQHRVEKSIHDFDRRALIKKRFKDNARIAVKEGRTMCEKARIFFQLNHEAEIVKHLLIGEICTGDEWSLRSEFRE